MKYYYSIFDTALHLLQFEINQKLNYNEFNKNRTVCYALFPVE